MVTGRRAFGANSKFSTLAAVIEREPASLAGEVPYELERIVTRCLKKDPERRFQHMHDLKVELQEFKEDSDSGRLQTAPVASKQAKPLRLVIGAAAAVVVVVIALTGWYWLSRQRSAEPEAPLTALPLTSYAGIEGAPTFSPDGNYVAFDRRPEGSGTNYDIYVKQIGVEPPQRLTTDPGEDCCPSWSPDGRFIAFLRQHGSGETSVILIPQRGGQERVVGESYWSLWGDLATPCVAWTPDAKWIAFPSAESRTPGNGLFLVSVETEEKRRLTDHKGDSGPAFSPDGRTLAFVRMEGFRIRHLLSSSWGGPPAARSA